MSDIVDCSETERMKRGRSIAPQIAGVDKEASTILVMRKECGEGTRKETTEKIVFLSFFFVCQQQF
jgi:hypothetical protein